MTGHYDAVVVGLGGVGSFALRALAKQTSGRFLGIEVGSLATNAGHSSRGESRIYRRAYFEHANYVPWIEFSLKILREMEESSGVSLMRECGTLLIEPAIRHTTRKLATSSELPPLLASSWNSAQLHNIPVEYLSPKCLRERFPQFQYKRHSMVGLLEPGGGLLRPERIMNTALQEAREGKSADVTILDQTRITKMVQNIDKSGRIELHVLHKGDALVVTSDKLLLSMGAWTANLIPSWKNILYPVRQIQAWIDTTFHSPELYSCQNMPTFVYMSPDWPESLYGVPCDDVINGLTYNGGSAELSRRGRWLKVGIHKQSMSHIFSFADHPPQATATEVDELTQAIPHALDERAWGVMPERPLLVETKPCLYTMSPDKHFVVGQPSDTKNIFSVAGLSGHGFKMAPALGQMMADFALGKDVAVEWNTDFCSPRRFDV